MDPRKWKVTITTKGELIPWEWPSQPVTPVPAQVVEIERAVLRRLLRERPIRPR